MWSGWSAEGMEEVYKEGAEGGLGIVWSGWSTEEMEEVYKEGAEGGLALYELLQFTVSVRLPK